MNIEVVYVCPVESGDQFVTYGWRFLQSYLENKPGMDHGTTIVCNGASPSNPVYAMFKLMPNCKFFERDNSGYDIGAFQHIAREVPADMMVFFGASSYVRGAGWLLRMIRAFESNPEFQYGSMGNRGNIPVNVWPHIRTTGFWMNPDLMKAYPTIVTRPEQRYEFEHGKNCLTERLKRRGIKSYVVTWHGQYDWANWDDDPNGYHRGNQSSLLSGDRNTDPPYHPRQ